MRPLSGNCAGITGRFFTILILTGALSCHGTVHPGGGDVLTGEVKEYKGKPTIHINGQPVSPVICALPDVPGGRWPWEELPQHNINLSSQSVIHIK